MSVRTVLASAVGSTLLATTLALGAGTAAQAAPAPFAAASQCSKAKNDFKETASRLQDAGQLVSAREGEVNYWRKKRNDAKKGSPAWKTASQNLATAQGQLAQARKQFKAAKQAHETARNRVNAYC